MRGSSFLENNPMQSTRENSAGVENADFSIGQPFGRPIGEFALSVVVKQIHFRPRAAAGPVYSRIC
jgi:hypothetical protein